MYSPQGEEVTPDDHIRLLLVEANIYGGYEIGLENAVSLVLGKNLGQPDELSRMYATLGSYRIRKDRSGSPGWEVWNRRVSDRRSYLLFSADLNRSAPIR
jgi:hypothetical protein